MFTSQRLLRGILRALGMIRYNDQSEELFCHIQGVATQATRQLLTRVNF